MSRGTGGGPPVSLTGTRRKPSTGLKPDGGRSGRVEAEWKQQRENPVVGVPQVPVLPSQQSPQEAPPATTGPRMPSATSPKKSQARRPRRMPGL
jgi:hypothetical protein